MTRNRILGLLIAAALVAVLSFLIFKTRSVDFEGHSEIVTILRELKQIDAEWNADVLRSKTGFNTNYDPVASPLPLIAKLESTLQERTAKFETDATDIGSALAAYRQSMDMKIALIENFKSQNAILRNSSRYLPVAARDLATALAASGVDGATRANIESQLNHTVTETMSYILTSDASQGAEIAARIATLRAASQRFPADIQEQAGMFAAHVETVLRQQEAGDKLLGQLTTLPTTRKIDALADAYNRDFDQQLMARQTYRDVLTVYAAALLAALVWLAIRLATSYRLLRRSNASLKKAHDELKESQMYLVQSEKMSALGQMVAGIAHEINTPLAYVKGTIDLLREQMATMRDLARCSHQLTRLMRNNADKELVKKQFLEVEDVAKRTVDGSMVDEMNGLLDSGSHGISQISEIVLNLKNFSRLDRAKVSEFSVEEGLESTLLLAHNMLKNKVSIVKEFEAVPHITCSPSQINQVFLNIISNAAQAIPDGQQGVITLRTARSGDNMVAIEIQDNGGGIPQDVLPKIFDPFFTTKEIGKGTGMGLSISYKIVEEHGGRIRVDTETGIGTVFTIELPIAPPQRKEDVEMFADDELALAA